MKYRTLRIVPEYDFDPQKAEFVSTGMFHFINLSNGGYELLGERVTLQHIKEKISIQVADLVKEGHQYFTDIIYPYEM